MPSKDSRQSDIALTKVKLPAGFTAQAETAGGNIAVKSSPPAISGHNMRHHSPSELFVRDIVTGNGQRYQYEILRQ